MDLTDAPVPVNPSPELQLAIAWGNLFISGDIEGAFKLVADNATSRVLPQSLGSPVKSKAEWKAHLSNITSTFKEFKLRIHDIIAGSGKVYMHATSSVISPTDGRFNNEYSYIWHTAPDSNGELKIVYFAEFIDSKASTEFVAQETARKAALNK